jgi:hypothetical protein
VLLKGGISALAREDLATGDCTPPSPDISAGTVNSGQTETRNLCFVIFTADVSKLMLSPNDDVTTAYGIADETRWFTLHKERVTRLGECSGIPPDRWRPRRRDR